MSAEAESGVLELLEPELVELELVGFEPFTDVDSSQPFDERDYEAHHDATLITAAPMTAVPRLYPNGAGTVSWPVQVRDQSGTPLPGVRVAFDVAAVRPNGMGWRSENGVVARFPSYSRPRVRQKIRSGQIRLLGTMRNPTVTTNSAGVAEGVYQVSHIGGNQPSVGRETIRASIEGSSIALAIDIGFDWLVPVPTVQGGLRIQNATGRHIHRDLAPRLVRLGEAVASAAWPHPVTITAATLRWGGLYPPHQSHRWGAELDLRPMTTDGAPGTYQSSNYDRPRTQRLVDALTRLGAKRIFFNDPQIKGVSPLRGHDNHLHASFASGPSSALTIAEAESTELSLA